MSVSPAEGYTVRAPLISFTVNDDGGTIAVILDGEFDLSAEASSTQVVEYVGELVVAAPRPVLVDMSGLTFLDASGIRFLLRVERVAKLASTTVEVCDANPDIRHLFTVVELTRFLNAP